MTVASLEAPQRGQNHFVYVGDLAILYGHLKDVERAVAGGPTRVARGELLAALKLAQWFADALFEEQGRSSDLIRAMRPRKRGRPKNKRPPAARRPGGRPNKTTPGQDAQTLLNLLDAKERLGGATDLEALREMVRAEHPDWRTSRVEGEAKRRQKALPRMRKRLGFPSGARRPRK